MLGWRKSSHSANNGACAEVADWRTSTYSGSNGDCVAAADWRTSTSCNGGACVEVASGVLVRDSQLGGASPVLTFSGDAWNAFTADLKAG